MKHRKFPLSEVTISNRLGRPIQSLVRMTDLQEFYIQSNLFLETFADFYEELPWEKNASENRTDRKSVSIKFDVLIKGNRFFMAKEKDMVFPIDYFLKEAFLEKRVHHLFGSIFSQYYKFTKDQLSNESVFLEVTFLREKISANENEKRLDYFGKNEEGSQVILHRENILGGESQIIEAQEDGTTEVIFQEKLNAGELVFVKKLKEKNNSKNRTFHQLTPIILENESKEIGWIDIMRFEIK